MGEGEEEEINASELSEEQEEIPAWMTVIDRPTIIKFKEFKLTDPNHNFTIVKPDGSIQEPAFKKTMNHGPRRKKGGKKRKK